MKLIAATVAGALLLAASFALLAFASESTGVFAIAGATGIVIAVALLGLTLLAWHWRSSRGYVSTSAVEPSTFYDDLAAAFDETTDGYDDGTMTVAR